jgi:hypothetical protein
MGFRRAIDSSHFLRARKVYGMQIFSLSGRRVGALSKMSELI